MNSVRDDGANCFVCGPNNPYGLQLKFAMVDDVCTASFTPPAHMVGYDNLVHGGVLFTVLDDAMANWLYFKGVRAHTAKCEIRYREPAKVESELRLEAWATQVKGRMVRMQGRAICAVDGGIVAETEGAFMIADGELKL